MDQPRSYYSIYRPYYQSCQRIWQAYSFYARGACVIRKGFQITGATDYADNSLDFAVNFRNRGESDLEHEAKTAFLASAFMVNFPRYFNNEQYYTLPLDLWQRLTIMLCHDSGECIIGDIPDDGSIEHDTKGKIELAAFINNIASAYPPEIQVEVNRLFESLLKKDSHVAKAMVALDKAEAILTNFLLESYGIHGSIAAKPNPTDQDLRYAKLIDSSLAADVWYMHMIGRTTVGFPREIMEPAITLITVAYCDVRGKDPAQFIV